MAIIGGDIIEIRFSHPVLGDGVFKPKAEEAFTLDPGGYMTNDEDGGVTGDGTAIYGMTNKRWSVEGVVAWDMNETNDLANYRALESSPIEADFTIQSINNTVWGAKGTPVGGNSGDMGAATFTMKIAGGGICKKIVG